MKYNQFLGNTTKTWLLADGAGQTKLCPSCAKQTPGNPMVLVMTPQGAPYMDAYWYLTLGPQSIQRDIWYDLQVNFASKQSLDNCEAVEFETDWISNDVHMDTGVQADFNSGTWRTFDLPTEKWVDSKIGLPGSDSWLSGLSVVSVCSVVQSSLLGLKSSGIRYEGLLVNGIWLSLGVFSQSVKVGGKLDHFNMAVQADGDAKGDAFTVQVSRADLRIL